MYSSISTVSSTKAIKRENYLDPLLKNFNANKPKNIALIGQWFSGKSVVLKQLASELKDAVYIDFSKISLSPENFAVDYISNTASWHLGKKVGLDDCAVNDMTKDIVYKVKKCELEKR